MTNAPRQNQWQAWFPMVAILGVAFLLLALGAVMVPSFMREAQRAKEEQTVNERLSRIGSALSRYSAAHGGKRPDHIGRLIASGLVVPQVFVDPRNPVGAPPTYGGQARPSTVYRFGDFVFVDDPALATPTGADPILVAVTVLDFDPGSRLHLSVNANSWSAGRVEWMGGLSAVVAADNSKRRSAALREIDIKDIEALDKLPVP